MNEVPLMVEAAPKIDIAAALKEVKQKSQSKIEAETAYKWSARSIACYQIFAETQELNWLLRAEDMRHEAIEHASLVEDNCKTLGFITRAFTKEQKKAKIPEKIGEQE